MDTHVVPLQRAAGAAPGGAALTVQRPGTSSQACVSLTAATLFPRLPHGSSREYASTFFSRPGVQLSAWHTVVNYAHIRPYLILLSGGETPHGG